MSLVRKHIGVAVIWSDRGQILIARRPINAILGGLWEFPGGKIEPGETVTDCIQREIREELGIEVIVGNKLIEIAHTYSNFQVTLYVYHCQHLQGEPQPLESDEVRWVTVDELNLYAFPEANQQIIDALKIDRSGL